MKIGSKRKNLSINDKSSLPHSDVVKKSTVKIHTRIKDKIREKRANSPKMFVVSLVVILTLLIIFIIGFAGLQSQGATEANIYKSKTGAYLESVYNASTIYNEDPKVTAEAIENVEAPKLGNLPLGFLSYSYVGAEFLRQDIENQVKGLAGVVRENGDFLDYCDFYRSTLDEIGALSISPSDRQSMLTNAKAKYVDLLAKTGQAVMPSQFEDNMTKVKTNLTETIAAVDKLIETLAANDTSGYAQNSYKYNMLNSQLLADVEPMKEYKNQINERLKLASKHFNEFRHSLE